MRHRFLFSVDRAPEGGLAAATLHGDIPSYFRGVKSTNGPSILAVSEFRYSPELAVLTVDSNHVLSLVEGEEDHWLVVRDPTVEKSDALLDSDFAGFCDSLSKKLGRLSSAVIEGLIEIDPSLDLVRKNSGRWVNLGINFCTLKPQPRNQDIQFTLYGSPTKFDHGGFLKHDQNSYSRGWIKEMDDVAIFLRHAQNSYAMRTS